MNLWGVPWRCLRMGWVGQWQHLFWWRILLCKIQPQIPPKKESSLRGRGGKGVWWQILSN